MPGIDMIPYNSSEDGVKISGKSCVVCFVCKFIWVMLGLHNCTIHVCTYVRERRMFYEFASISVFLEDNL